MVLHSSFFFIMKFNIKPTSSLIDQFTIFKYKDKIPLGCYVDDLTNEDLSNKLSSANFTYIKDTPNKLYELYLTTEIGIGYPNHVSKQKLIELLATKKIDEKTIISLDFIYNTIFAYIDLKQINGSIFLTNETYLIVEKSTRKVMDINIGEYIPFNILLGRGDLDGISFPIGKLISTTKLRRIDLHQ